MIEGPLLCFLECIAKFFFAFVPGLLLSLVSFSVLCKIGEARDELREKKRKENKNA